MRYLSTVLTALTTMTLFTTQLGAQESSQRPTIAIRDLDFAAQLTPDVQRDLNGWTGLAVLLGHRDGNGGRVSAQTNMDLLAKQLTVLLTDAIVNSNAFVVRERANLSSVLDEQDLGASGRAARNQSTARTGEIQTARYIISGSIVKFAKVDRKTGGAAGAIGGIIRGGLGVGVESRSTDYEVGISLRVVDATTSDIVASVKTSAIATGEVSRKVGGAGALGMIAGGVLSKSATGDKEKRLAEAMEMAAIQATDLLVDHSAKGLIAGR